MQTPPKVQNTIRYTAYPSVTLRYIRIVAVAFLATLALASCQSQSTSPSTNYTASASSILTADSANYPNGCLLDTATLKADLGLTDSQVARIGAVRDSLHEAAAAEIAAASGDPATIHAILEKYEHTLRTDIAAVLTSDQLTKLQTLLAARGDGGRCRNGGFRDVRDGRFLGQDSIIIDSAMMAHLQTDLTLTSDQTVQIRALADSLNADTSTVDRHAAFMTGMQNILTTTQFATLQSLLDARREEDRRNGFDDRRRGGPRHH